MKSQGFKKLSYQEALLKKRVKDCKRGGVPSLGKLLTIAHNSKHGSKRSKKGSKKKIKRVKLPSISKLKKTLWGLVSLFIRTRDNFTCFTCGRQGSGGGIHAGHLIPSAAGGGLLRYHCRNIHAQCYNCNINLGSNGAEYYRRALALYGQVDLDKLFDLKNHIVQVDRYFLTSLIDLYKQGNQEEIIKFIETCA